MSRRVVAALACSLLLLTCASATAAEGDTPARHVIPGGQETVLRRLLTPAEAPLAGAWTLDGIEAREDRVLAHYAGADGARFTVELHHGSQASPADRRTERFAVRFPPPGAPEPVRDALERQLRAHEGGFLWKRAGPPVAAGGPAPPGSAAVAPGTGAAPPDGPPAPRGDWRDPRLGALVRPIALGLLLVFALCLPVLVGAVRSALQALGRRERVAVLAAAGAGLVVRLLAPHQFVKVFMGYGQVNAAWDFERLPRYGSSVPALHHVALRLGPADYDTVLYLHSLLGAATVLLLPLWFRRLGAPRGSAAVGAALLALLPLFVKDHNSESYLVPSLFWLSAGLVLITAAAHGRRAAWPAAAVALALACLARPFNHLFVPALVVLTFLAGDLPRGALRRDLRWALPSALGAALLIVPNLLHVVAAARHFAAAGALPGLSSGAGAGADWAGLPVKLVTENAAFDPALVPTVVPALALVALLLARGRLRRTFLGLAGVAVVWWAVFFVDLPPISRPRLQAPGLAGLALLAGAGAVLAVERVRARGRAAAARWLGAALGLVTAVSAAFTIPALWARGNADEEADAFAAALGPLPPEPVVFVRLGEGDEPRWQVHRAWPDRLPLTVVRGDTVLGIADFLASGPVDRPVYVYLGVRCHAASREGRRGSPLPAGRAHPLCERVRALPLVPVFERNVPNHPSADFPWYPEDRPTLPVGLYRLAALPAEGATAAP